MRKDDRRWKTTPQFKVLSKKHKNFALFHPKPPTSRFRGDRGHVAQVFLATDNSVSAARKLLVFVLIKRGF